MRDNGLRTRLFERADEMILEEGILCPRGTPVDYSRGSELGKTATWPLAKMKAGAIAF